MPITPEETGEIIFIQNNIPPLQAGEYLISVEQDLLNTKPTRQGDTINESYLHTRHIAVQGERFALDPAEFNTIFPPPDNQGKYDNVLPHVVFTRLTLPWERSPDGTDTGKPWLALLVFHADDPPPVVQNIQAGDLQRLPFRRAADAQPTPSTLPATAVSYPDGFAALPPDQNGKHPQFAMEYGENLYDRCQAIDLPVTLFSAIAPSLEDITWLAHARTVRPASNSADAEGDYSVVVANRLPDPNQKCTVHLVSLEGLAPFLPANSTYAPATILLPDGKTPAQTIRLISLQNWSFTSVDPTETFEGYLEALSVGPLGIPAGVGPGDTDAEKTVRNAFDMGYTAMNHRTRLGDRTVSWYRGPLVPFQVPDTIFVPLPDPETIPVTEPITTSDQLLRYDPGSGMFDSTYAAAWEVGRLLALQDKSFSVPLYNWKRANAQKTALAAEQAIIEQQFGQVLPLVEGALKAQGSAAILEAAALFITTSLKEHIVPGNPDGDITDGDITDADTRGGDTTDTDTTDTDTMNGDTTDDANREEPS